MITRSFTAFGCLVALGVASMAVGCSAGADDGSAEKVAAASAALILTNPAAVPTFPDGTQDSMKNPFTCEGKMSAQGGSPGVLASNEFDPYTGGSENYLAAVTTGSLDNSGVSDPYTTLYTHGYTFNNSTCAQGDLNCALNSDFFGIPKAHGFKYRVQKITSITCNGTSDGRPICVPTLSTNFYYAMGIQRVDQNWSYYPWYSSSTTQCGGTACPQPWTLLAADGSGGGASSHPPYGSDYKSADWASLWNLAYTYSLNGPNWKNTTNIRSENHQCAAIFYKAGNGGIYPLDFLVAMEKHDPRGPEW